MGRESAFAGASDMELVEQVRAGELAAYGELWSRHAQAVAAISRSFTGYDPDDVTQETFVRILEHLQAGNGPRTAFRAYAVMTARNVAANMARKRGSDDLTGVADEVFEASGLVSDDPAQGHLDDRFVLEVFRSLPERWQEALWYKEVEGLPVQRFSTFLGMSENATSALLTRAREGFRQAWIAATIARSGDLSPECRWTLERIPQYVRGKSSGTTRARIEAHLRTCDDCAAAAEEAEQLQRRLFGILLPAMLGGPAAMSYLEWTRSDDSEAAPGPAAAAGRQGRAASASALAVRSSDVLGRARATRAAVLPLALLATAALAAALGAIGAPLTPALDEPGLSTKPAAAGAPGAEAQHASEWIAKGSGGAGERTEQAHEPRAEQAPGTSEPPASEPDPKPPTDEPEPPTIAPPPETATDPKPPTDEPKPPADEPVGVPSTLSASPLDGAETGVYPRLIGAGVPGATVSLTVSNELGETRSGSATVAADGTWKFTPGQLRGELTIRAHQSYTRDGVAYLEEPTTLGVFRVGDGLRMKIVATGAAQSVATVTGFGAESKNQSANLTSSTRGVLAVNHRMTAAGEAVIVIPFARASLGDVTFWQGDTSHGPRRYWYIATAP